MIKKVAVAVIKLLILYVALYVVLIDLILLESALPGYSTFERSPFIQAALLTLAIATIISVVRASKTPAIFSIVCIGYSGFVFIYPRLVSWFVALFVVVAAISFLFRNRVTEPLLVMLPVVAGAWVFLSWIYTPYLLGWALYTTGNKDLVGSIATGVSTVGTQAVPALSLLPLLLMYFHGKQSYRRIGPLLLRLSKKTKMSA